MGLAIASFVSVGSIRDAAGQTYVVTLKYSPKVDMVMVGFSGWSGDKGRGEEGQTGSYLPSSTKFRCTQKSSSLSKYKSVSQKDC